MTLEQQQTKSSRLSGTLMAVSNTKPRLKREITNLLRYFFQVVTFSSVHHLTLHFPTNFGADNTKIYYIGLAGEFTQVRMAEK